MEVGGSDFLMNYFLSRFDAKTISDGEKATRNASCRRSELILGSLALPEDPRPVHLGHVLGASLHELACVH